MSLWPHSSDHGPTLTLGTHGNLLLPRTLTLNPADTASHKHVIGITGQGKGKLLQSIFTQLLAQRSVGVSLIDPHRDLARDILAHLIQTGYFDQPEAYERLIYIDFGRTDSYTPFNVLLNKSNAHNTAYAFLEAVKRAWPSIGDGTAPQLENILLAGTTALVEAGLPLTKLPDLLTNKTFRDDVLTDVRDPAVHNFFVQRFERWSGASQMIESTLRRVFLLTFSPVLRNTLGDSENWLDFRHFIDNKISVIYDLGGIQNPDARRLLGCLITVGYEMAALSRVDIAGGAAARSKHHLILDEFAEFVSQSEEALSRVLALARKYGLYLTLAHQTWSQASAKLRGALQNCGTEVVFRLGRPDAELTAKALGRADPFLVKDEAKTDTQRDSYMDLGSQWELWTQAIQELEPRRAFVKTGSRVTTQIRTLTVSEKPIDQSRMDEVLATYAAKYHRVPASPRSTLRADAPAQSHFNRVWNKPQAPAAPRQGSR